jgi:hypothetical protein
MPGLVFCWRCALIARHPLYRLPEIPRIMRLSRYFLPILRETPKESEIV